MTFEKAATREAVIGPVHPMVRVHPFTKKRALYLGRRYDRGAKQEQAGATPDPVKQER